MHKFLQLLKKLFGEKLTRAIRPLGHGIKTYLAALYFGFPAKKLTIIGITGTKGKTTTTIFCGRLFNQAHIITGYISTGVINVSGQSQDEFLNPYKMTSIDGWNLHKYLSEMVKNQCKVAVLEMSSLGLEQNRHWGLFGFDVAVFLNIYPEHIEAHGSWEKYKKAKAILFQNLKPKGIAIGNGSSEMLANTQYMFEQIKTQTAKNILIKPEVDYSVADNSNSLYKNLRLQNQPQTTKCIADFEIMNMAFAYFILKSYDEQKALDLLGTAVFEKISGVPGRMEFVIQHGEIIFDKDQSEQPEQNNQNPKKNLDINVLVDYAHEPESIKQLLQTLQKWRNSNLYTQVIHILSSDGAGRDNWKKPIMGDLSYQYADFSIITTDNYDANDDPQTITNLLSQNYPKSEDIHKTNKHYITLIKRQEAFEYALKKATEYTNTNQKAKILIVSTGVGSEKGLTQPSGILDWDERLIWKDVYANFLKQN